MHVRWGRMPWPNLQVGLRAGGEPLLFPSVCASWPEPVPVCSSVCLSACQQCHPGEHELCTVDNSLHHAYPLYPSTNTLVAPPPPPPPSRPLLARFFLLPSCLSVCTLWCPLTCPDPLAPNFYREYLPRCDPSRLGTEDCMTDPKKDWRYLPLQTAGPSERWKPDLWQRLMEELQGLQSPEKTCNGEVFNGLIGAGASPSLICSPSFRNHMYDSTTWGRPLTEEVLPPPPPPPLQTPTHSGQPPDWTQIDRYLSHSSLNQEHASCFNTTWKSTLWPASATPTPPLHAMGCPSPVRCPFLWTISFRPPFSHTHSAALRTDAYSL